MILKGFHWKTLFKQNNFSQNLLRCINVNTFMLSSKIAKTSFRSVNLRVLNFCKKKI